MEVELAVEQLHVGEERAYFIPTEELDYLKGHASFRELRKHWVGVFSQMLEARGGWIVEGSILPVKRLIARLPDNLGQGYA